jgi:hypothetical protein
MDAIEYFSPRLDTHLSYKRILHYAWQEFSKQYVYYCLFTIISLVIPLTVPGLFKYFGASVLLINLILLILNPPLQIGTAAYLHHKHEKGEYSFLSFFKPFRQKVLPLAQYSLYVIAAYIIITLPLITTQVLLEQNQVLSAEAAWPWWFRVLVFLDFIILLGFVVCATFAPYYIYFFNFKPLQAIKASYYTIKPSWFWFLGLFIYFALWMLLGFICLIVGIIIAIPVIRIASYYVFAKYSGIDFELNQEPTEE